MWHIKENKSIGKLFKALPQPVLKKYELWKNLIFRHGPEILKKFPGFHDEKLKGERHCRPVKVKGIQNRVG